MSVEVITVDNVIRCRDISRHILRAGVPIAIDAEGMRLGATGRLTLLQIGTEDGKVYLIDVVDATNLEDTSNGRQLLEEGKIKDILESDKVLKIVHSSFSDSAALYHQFDIKLQHVFDTQCAHFAIEEAKGVIFPIKLSLENIIETYGTKKHTSKEFRDVWVNDEQYWLRRPLSEESIKYASEDVMVLHELYYKMKGISVDKPGVLKIYKYYLDLQLNEGIEPERVKKEKKDREMRKARELLDDTDSRTSPENYSDDQTKAFHTFRKFHEEFKGVQDFRRFTKMDDKLAQYQIDTFKGYIQNKEYEPILNGFERHILYMLVKHVDPEISKSARIVQKKLKLGFTREQFSVLIDRISCHEVREYKDLNKEEKQALQYYQEFREDFNPDEVPESIKRLEKQMSSLELDCMELWAQKDQLFNKAGPREKGIIRTLIKHNDSGLKERASNLNKKVKIAEMKACITEMDHRILAGERLPVTDLTDREKRSLRTLREFRQQIDTTQFSIGILEMECDMSRSDLDRWEGWNQSRQLRNRAGGVERAVIRTLTNHPDQGIAQRAKVLFDVLNTRHGSHSNRGRGRGGRGRRN